MLAVATAFPEAVRGGARRRPWALFIPLNDLVRALRTARLPPTW